MKRLLYREAVRGSRLVLPPTFLLISVGSVWLLLEVGLHLAQRPVVMRVLLFHPLAFQSLQVLLVCVSAAFFGAGRLVVFHPYARSAYRDWLKTTCWHVGKPLPLGPVTLTWSDALLLIVGMVIVWHANTPVPPLAVVIAFSVPYLFFAGYALIREGSRGYGYAIAFGLCGMLIYGAQPEKAVFVAALTYLVAIFGLRRSLARLPAHEPGWIERAAKARLPSVKGIQFNPSHAGWPFGNLCPKRDTHELPLFDATIIPILAGWLLFCLITFYSQWSDKQPKIDPADRLFGMFLLSIVPLARLIPCAKYNPPISLLSRVATRRFLIWSYDRVFAAPLASLLVIWGLGPRVVGSVGLPLSVQLPVLVTLAGWVALIPGPSYRNWILSSECRIIRSRPRRPATTAASPE